MRYISIVLVLLFVVTLYIYSQKVVISEYYNVSGDPLGEWTELLVIEDNVDLVGYTLRDNAGSTPPPSQWTGGIRFRNHQLWKNLRAGTIIVINHRYSAFQAVDVDKRDGYIEVDAEDETYFEKRCFSCIVGPEWYQKALNIAQESEIVQLLDQNDNHVHALAHMPSQGGDWLNLPSPKICYPGSITRGGVTIRVCPGLSIAAYNKGFDTREEEVTQSADLITKGKPNNRVGFLNQNQLFWRSLREPKWNLPSATARVFKDSVVISWNAMVDPNPSDSLSGYLIVRIPFDQLSNALHPRDGGRYSVGDNLGSAVVVGKVNYSQATRFVDKFSLLCGLKYVYRVYAYRFRYDDFNEDGDETNARGCSYNQTNFAQVEVEKPLPSKPEIVVVGGKTRVCEGDTVVLKIQNKNTFENVFLRWFKDGSLLLEGLDSLLVFSSGEYYLEIVDTLGCSVNSNKIAIEVIQYPQLVLYANGKEIQKDTTIVLCPNEKINFKLLGWFRFKLFKDDKLIEDSDKSEWIISSSGTYYFTASNSICTSRTHSVTVRFQNPILTFVPKSISFFVDKNEAYKDTSVLVINDGLDTIVVESLDLENSAFELISPKTPFVVLPKGNVTIVLRFKPLKSGHITSRLFIRKNCNTYDTLLLEGTKAKSVLIHTADVIDFGIVPNCYDYKLDSTLTLISDFDEEIKIEKIILDNPFELIAPKVPVNLQPGDKINVLLKLTNIGTGTYVGALKVYFRYSNILDSILFQISGRVEEINYFIKKNFVENIVFDECETSKKLSFIFENNSDFGLSLNLKSPSVDIKTFLSDVSVAERDSVKLEFELVPNKLGYSKTMIYLMIEPCKILDSIEINYTKRGIIVSFESDTIDFGKINTCNNSLKFQKAVKVQIIGDSLYLTKIKQVNFKSPFEISIPKDSLLFNGSELSITFNPTRNGFFFESISLVLAPCDIEYFLYVKGEYIEGKYVFNVDTIDFGEVEIGTQKTKTISLSNIGDTNIFINQVIIFDIENFSVSPNGIIGLTLRTSDTFGLDYKFHPFSEGEFETVSKLALGFPCDTTLQIVLRGIGKAPKPRQLFVSIDNHSFKPYTIAKIPIKFKFENTPISSIDSMRFEVEYYPRVFNVASVYSGSFVVEPQIDFQNQRIKISLKTNKQNQSEGVLAYLEGMVLIGDQKFSELKFSNFSVFGDEKPNVVLQNGKVQIDSICVPDLRLISTELLPEFKVQLFENKLILKVNSYSDNLKAVVYLYDLLGRCVFKETLLVEGKGVKTFVYPFANGINQFYICNIQMGEVFVNFPINYICCE